MLPSRVLRWAGLVGLFWLCGLPLAAQQSVQTGMGDGGSPHYKTTWNNLHGARITIEYGRPYLKHRTVGKEVAPFGKEWRTGADQATTLTTDKPLRFGTLPVPAGTYTLYTLPNPKEWQLIVSKKTGQWGIPYPGKPFDLGRAPMKVSTLPQAVEQLTISIDPDAAGGVLAVNWGTTRASIPFTIG